MLIAGIPVDFILFAFTLLGVATLQGHTLRVAVIGLVVITLLLRNYTQILSGFENAWKNPGAYVPSKADPTAGALQKDIAGAQAHDASGSGLIHDLASASEYAGLSGAW